MSMIDRICSQESLENSVWSVCEGLWSVLAFFILVALWVSVRCRPLTGDRVRVHVSQLSQRTEHRGAKAES